MRRATGNAVAALVAVLGTVALAGVLAGCRAQSTAAQPAGGVTSPADATAAAVSGAGAPSATSPANTGVDSDLNSVDDQLSGLDSALAQATASPSDGG